MLRKNMFAFYHSLFPGYYLDLNPKCVWTYLKQKETRNVTNEMSGKIFLSMKRKIGRITQTDFDEMERDERESRMKRICSFEAIKMQAVDYLFQESPRVTRLMKKRKNRAHRENLLVKEPFGRIFILMQCVFTVQIFSCIICH